MSIINVENLGKKYIISHAKTNAGWYTYGSFRDTVASSVKDYIHRIRHPFSAKESKSGLEDFWALKNLNFSIGKGERVGIIGRNGAGKSTLLKVLSRITEPTTGVITMKGRVASLLEVGTGFHPELTGRENVFLNGAVLGMSRSEIKKKFDEIVAFAEVEQFLDTPVKRYSSGMYVRLAFAVAAHLEPEILLVDEVLAVGDAQFQKKCMGKMEDVSKDGRTIFFVSHNMGAIENLCQRVICLSHGEISFDGATSEGIRNYLETDDVDSEETAPGVFDLSNRTNRYANGRIIIKKLICRNSTGKNTNVFKMWESAEFEVSLDGMSDLDGANIALIIKNRMGQSIACFNTQMKVEYEHGDRSFREKAVLRIDKLPFVADSYSIYLSMTRQEIEYLEKIESAGVVQIIDSDIYGSPYKMSTTNGLVCLEGGWRISNA